MDIFEEKRQLIEKIACQKEDTLESKLELKQLLLKDTNGGKLYKYRSFDKDGYSLLHRRNCPFRSGICSWKHCVWS